MILSDKDIAADIAIGWLSIEPYEERFLAPASYDIHMARKIQICRAEEPFDPANLEAASWEECIIPDDGYILWPHMFILAGSVERIRLPVNVAALLDGSSTLSRSGLAVHQTGQWIDPGFEGHLTCEIKCNNNVGYILRPGMKIGQLVFAQTISAVREPYHGRYQNQEGAVPPRTKADAVQLALPLEE